MERGSERNSPLLLSATILLAVLALIGSSLSGIDVLGYTLFPFRLYLPFYALFIVYLLARRRPVVELTSTALLTSCFFFYVFGSFLWTPMSGSNLSQLFILGTSFILVASIYYTLTNRAAVSIFVTALAAFVVASLVVASVEVLTTFHLPESGLNTLPDRSPFTSWSSVWFYNSNDLSYFLSLSAPFFFVTLLDELTDGENRRRGRIGLNGLAFVGCSVVTYLNGSRASIAAIGIMLVVVLPLFYFQGSMTDVTYPTRLLTVGTMLVVPVVLALPLLVDNPFAGAAGSSLSIRWQLLVEGVEMVYRNVLGAGVGQFKVVLANSTAKTKGVYSPHNWVVFLLAEYGIPGGMLSLVVLGKMLDQHLHQYVESADTLNLAVFGSLVTFVVSGLGPSNAMLLKSTWVFFAVSLALLRINHTEQPVRQRRPPGESYTTTAD